MRGLEASNQDSEHFFRPPPPLLFPWSKIPNLQSELNSDTLAMVYLPLLGTQNGTPKLSPSTAPTRLAQLGSKFECSVGRVTGRYPAFFQTSQRPWNLKYDPMKISIVIKTSGRIFKEHACYCNESEYVSIIGTLSPDCLLEILSFPACPRPDRV